MVYPNKPQIAYSYTGFQQSQGNNSFPGTQLDNDLFGLKQSSAATITFKVRAGANAAGTTTFNGTGGARRMGGVAASSITITEIKA